MNYQNKNNKVAFLCVFIILIVFLGVIFSVKNGYIRFDRIEDTSVSEKSEKNKTESKKSSSESGSSTTDSSKGTSAKDSSAKDNSASNTAGGEKGSAKSGTVTKKASVTTAYAANTTVPGETTTKPQRPKKYRQYGTFSCRRLGINDIPLYYGDDDRCLNAGIGTSLYSQPPGYGSRSLMSGHNLTYFAPMKDVGVGDIFELNLSYGYYKFRVYKTEVMTPAEFDPNLINVPSDEIIVYTCYPFNGQTGSTQRLFMFCEMLEGPRMY